MKILVSGFDPFGGEAINPAYEAVKRLPKSIEGAEILTVEIPTVFQDSYTVLKAAIGEHNPDAVVCVGQAGGRFGLTVERVGINCDDARIPDNKGQQPIDTAIFEDGEAAYFSNLPVKAMVDNVRKQCRQPAAVSNTAGTFVCNHILYSLLYLIDKDPRFSSVRGGFIHVPFLHQQVVEKPNTASMSLDDITEALGSAIAAIVTHSSDIKSAEGTVC